MALQVNNNLEVQLETLMHLDRPHHLLPLMVLRDQDQMARLLQEDKHSPHHRIMALQARDQTAEDLREIIMDSPHLPNMALQVRVKTAEDHREIITMLSPHLHNMVPLDRTVEHLPEILMVLQVKHQMELHSLQRRAMEFLIQTVSRARIVSPTVVSSVPHLPVTELRMQHNRSRAQVQVEIM